jgi:hypothetical protein
MDGKKQLSENECTINLRMASQTETCGWMKLEKQTHTTWLIMYYIVLTEF